jgi:hypothetical protein
MHLVQPVPDWWNVVITQVRHDEQMFASSSRWRLDAHNRDVRDIEFVIVSLMNSYRDSLS